MGDDPEHYRAQLNLVIQEHSYLLAETAYAYLGGRPDHASAAHRVLETENTPLIRDFVSRGLSMDQRDEFANAWHQWTITVLEYAAALESGNALRTREIWDDRFRIGNGMAAPLAAALESVDPEMLRLSMQQHVELTLGMVWIMHERPAIEGYWGAWHTTEFSRPIGDVLAEGVVQQVPHRFDGGTPTGQTAAGTLRTRMSMLMHEYGLLLMNATSAIVEGRMEADAPAAMETLDARNSIPLARIVGSFDPEVEAEFLELWRQHIYAAAGFAGRLRDGDVAGQAAQRERLHARLSDLADLIVEVSPQTSRSGLGEALARQGDLLLDAIAQQARGEDLTYVASLFMARHSQVLAETLVAALSEQFADRMAVEDQLYAATRAWNEGRMADYLSYWADGGIQDRFGVGRQEAIQLLESQADNRQPLTIQRIVSASVVDGEATVEWIGTAGVALQRMRASLVDNPGDWHIASFEQLDGPIPPGVNAVVDIDVRPRELVFDASLIDGGYIGFRARNLTQQACRLVLYRLTGAPGGATPPAGVLVGATVLIEPGQTGSMGFLVPLSPDSYRLACIGRDGEPAGAPTAEFDLPYQQ